MRVGLLRERLTEALATAMRTLGADGVAITADRAKAIGAAVAGHADESDVDVDRLELSTRGAATVLGFHPEHVRRLIRSRRLPARRTGGDYRILVDDLWPFLEARHREPGRRRPERRP